MQQLHVHWNELSFPPDAEEQMLHQPHWQASAQSTYSALQDAWRIQPQSRVSIPKGVHYANRHLLSWLDAWLSKDQLRRLKGRLDQIDQPAQAVRIQHAGRDSVGLVSAFVADSWVWSFASELHGMSETSLVSRLVSIGDDHRGEEVSIRNIASSEHVSYWRADLVAWGSVQSDTCRIGSLGIYDIFMYPRDHGYPHVHVSDRADSGSKGKFRVDLFRPLTDSPEAMNAAMESWIERNRDTLLRSWQLCSAGQHPLRIGE